MGRGYYCFLGRLRRRFEAARIYQQSLEATETEVLGNGVESNDLVASLSELDDMAAHHGDLETYGAILQSTER